MSNVNKKKTKNTHSKPDPKKTDLQCGDQKKDEKNAQTLGQEDTQTGNGACNVTNTDHDVTITGHDVTKTDNDVTKTDQDRATGDDKLLKQSKMSPTSSFTKLSAIPSEARNIADGISPSRSQSRGLAVLPAIHESADEEDEVSSSSTSSMSGSPASLRRHTPLLGRVSSKPNLMSISEEIIYAQRSTNAETAASSRTDGSSDERPRSTTDRRRCKQLPVWSSDSSKTKLVYHSFDDDFPSPRELVSSEDIREVVAEAAELAEGENYYPLAAKAGKTSLVPNESKEEAIEAAEPRPSRPHRRSSMSRVGDVTGTSITRESRSDHNVSSLSEDRQDRDKEKDIHKPRGRERESRRKKRDRDEREREPSRECLYSDSPSDSQRITGSPDLAVLGRIQSSGDSSILSVDPKATCRLQYDISFSGENDGTQHDTREAEPRSLESLVDDLERISSNSRFGKRTSLHRQRHTNTSHDGNNDDSEESSLSNRKKCVLLQAGDTLYKVDDFSDMMTRNNLYNNMIGEGAPLNASTNHPNVDDSSTNSIKDPKGNETSIDDTNNISQSNEDDMSIGHTNTSSPHNEDELSSGHTSHLDLDPNEPVKSASNTDSVKDLDAGDSLSKEPPADSPLNETMDVGGIDNLAPLTKNNDSDNQEVGDQTSLSIEGQSRFTSCDEFQGTDNETVGLSAKTSTFETAHSDLNDATIIDHADAISRDRTHRDHVDAISRDSPVLDHVDAVPFNPVDPIQLFNDVMLNEVMLNPSGEEYHMNGFVCKINETKETFEDTMCAETCPAEFLNNAELSFTEEGSALRQFNFEICDHDAPGENESRIDPTRGGQGEEAYKPEERTEQAEVDTYPPEDTPHEPYPQSFEAVMTYITNPETGIIDLESDEFRVQVCQDAPENETEKHKVKLSESGCGEYIVASLTNDSGEYHVCDAGGKRIPVTSTSHSSQHEAVDLGSVEENLPAGVETTTVTQLQNNIIAHVIVPQDIENCHLSNCACSAAEALDEAKKVEEEVKEGVDVGGKMQEMVDILSDHDADSNLSELHAVQTYSDTDNCQMADQDDACADTMDVDDQAREVTPLNKEVREKEEQEGVQNDMEAKKESRNIERTDKNVEGKVPENTPTENGTLYCFNEREELHKVDPLELETLLKNVNAEDGNFLEKSSVLLDQMKQGLVKVDMTRLSATIDVEGSAMCCTEPDGAIETKANDYLQGENSDQKQADPSAIKESIFETVGHQHLSPHDHLADSLKPDTGHVDTNIVMPPNETIGDEWHEFGFWKQEVPSDMAAIEGGGACGFSDKADASSPYTVQVVEDHFGSSDRPKIDLMDMGAHDPGWASNTENGARITRENLTQSEEIRNVPANKEAASSSVETSEQADIFGEQHSGSNQDLFPNIQTIDSEKKDYGGARPKIRKPINVKFRENTRRSSSDEDMEEVERSIPYTCQTPKHDEHCMFQDNDNSDLQTVGDLQEVIDQYASTDQYADYLKLNDDFEEAGAVAPSLLEGVQCTDLDGPSPSFEALVNIDMPARRSDDDDDDDHGYEEDADDSDLDNYIADGLEAPNLPRSFTNLRPTKCSPPAGRKIPIVDIADFPTDRPCVYYPDRHDADMRANYPRVYDPHRGEDQGGYPQKRASLDSKASLSDERKKKGMWKKLKRSFSLKDGGRLKRDGRIVYGKNEAVYPEHKEREPVVVDIPQHRSGVWPSPRQQGPSPRPPRLRGKTAVKRSRSYRNPQRLSLLKQGAEVINGPLPAIRKQSTGSRDNLMRSTGGATTSSLTPSMVSSVATSAVPSVTERPQRPAEKPKPGRLKALPNTHGEVIEYFIDDADKDTSPSRNRPGQGEMTHAGPASCSARRNSPRHAVDKPHTAGNMHGGDPLGKGRKEGKWGCSLM